MLRTITDTPRVRTLIYGGFAIWTIFANIPQSSEPPVRQFNAVPSERDIPLMIADWDQDNANCRLRNDAAACQRRDVTDMENLSLRGWCLGKQIKSTFEPTIWHRC